MGATKVAGQMLHGAMLNKNSLQPLRKVELNSTFGVQGWRSGESTRLPPMWPGFDSQTRRHMWVEFVGSLLCTERFSPGTPGRAPGSGFSGQSGGVGAVVRSLPFNPNVPGSIPGSTETGIFGDLLSR